MIIKYPKCPKIFQKDLKYINIFPSKALQNLPKLGFLVRKETIWQPWLEAFAAVLSYFMGHRRPREVFEDEQNFAISFFYKEVARGVGSEPGASQFHLFSHFHHFTAELQRSPNFAICLLWVGF
jgi:hypothetical protein